MKAITHAGIFHADDVFAAAYLMLHKNTEIKIIRRDPTPEELTNPNVIVFDIGGQFNTGLNNFDHHQWENKPSRGEGEIPPSSSGLVFDRKKSFANEEIRFRMAKSSFGRRLLKTRRV